jgi:hypothetical protein
MGIRRLTYHIRNELKIWVTRSAVYRSLRIVDREGLEQRRKSRLNRRLFHADGPNQVWAFDGFDKLAYWGFPIHGCVDVYSRYLIWLRVGISNRDARWPLAYYLDAIDEQATEHEGMIVSFRLIDLAIIPYKLRSDRGTETVDIYGVHKSFHSNAEFGNPTVCYVYGRSVHNQKIECYWSGFIKQWVCRWQEIFGSMAFEELWWADDPLDRIALVYIYMPILRAELIVHRRDYNSYPMRQNLQSNLPSGQPQDNYFLNEQDHSIRIDPNWTDIIRRSRLTGFDADEVFESETLDRLDAIMEDSPHGEVVTIANAGEQYLYLRECLHGQEEDLD